MGLERARRIDFDYARGSGRWLPKEGDRAAGLPAQASEEAEGAVGGASNAVGAHVEGELAQDRVDPPVGAPAEEVVRGGLDRVPRCVAREFASNLGLPGRLDRPGSVFGPSGPVAGFAPRDLVLLRMLYDPRLRNGMGAAEARPLLPAVAAAALAP